MRVLNEEVPQNISDYAATLPYSEAKKIYADYKNKELYIPYSAPEENPNERVVLGTLQRFGQSIEVIPEGIGIVGGQMVINYGSAFRDTPLHSLSDVSRKVGEVFITSANSSLNEKRKRQAQSLIPMTEEEQNSILSKSVATGTDYATQIALAMISGPGALAAMGVRMSAETAIEGLEQYKQEHPEDTELKGYMEYENINKELALNTAKTALNLYVEKAFGAPKQVSQFRKALKTPSVGVMGVGKAAAKGYALGFAEEWGTETIQGITDTTFDALLGRFKDFPELEKAYTQSITDAVYAGIFGGGFAASGHVLARGKAIKQVSQAISNVVPEKDLEIVATAIVDNHIAKTKELISTQIALSTQLRDKHGDIFNAMNVAAKQAMMNSGVTRTMTEDEIAQHSSELATLFADQVLAEANKRNVPIMDVIQDKDIVYDPVKKELRLAPPKQERTTQKIEEKKKKIREKKKQVTEGIKTPEEIALERKKEDTDITDLEEIERDNLDALRMIAFRVADDIDAEFGDMETDFLDLAQVVGDESSLNDNMHMALMMAIPEGYEIDDYQIQKKKEIFEEFGKRLAYEPGVYKDYAQIGFDEYMNRVREAWDRSVLRRDLPVFLQESAEIDKGEGVRPEMEFYQSEKGMFDANSKVINLFENADASTLDHELAHFWLDNMWTYATSGAASEAYKAQFQAVKDFLGVKPDQQYLTYNQHEKFASAYEKYIHRGIIPNSIMGNVFDNYERFIRNVYNSIDDIQAGTKQGKKKAFKLTPEIIKFFDSMIRGGVDIQAIEGSMAVEARNEEAQKADDTTMKEAKDVVEKEPVREVLPEIAPVKVEGETKESRLFNRLKNLVGAEGSVEYSVAHIQEQREKANKMWKENPEKARAILNGTEQADDILRQALYTEQQRIALENGDTNTFLSSLRKQTDEATRMGQELAALRGVAEDITDPAYWIRSAETEALKNLAKKQTKNLENAMGNSPLVELTTRLDKDIKSLQKEVMSKATDEEKMKVLKEGVKSIAEKYQGLEQPDTVFNQIDWDNEDFANDYIENKVKEKLGISLPKETAKAFIQTAHDLDILSKQRDEFGNPIQAFYVKKDELERMRNSHTPTSRTKVLISTIGRSNMLTAPATSVLNVVSNTQNYLAENIIRKINNAIAGKTNDNIVSKELMDKYRGKAWEVFWSTGYDMSFMTSLLDERLYKGESITHSEGQGAVRAVGRFAEKWVFSRLISSPDIYFKSVLGFTNFVGNEATDIAYNEGLTGEQAKARANELFKDAIKIEPETDLGKQIRLKAQTDALVLTFQQDTKLSKMLLDVRNSINKGTGDIGIGDIMSPFIKTPANILSMSFDAAVGPFASPVNLIGALNDMKNKNYKSARVLQAVRQTTTAALAYVVIGLLASMLIDDDDYIPDYAQLTQKERQAVRARGGSFGAIRVNGQWISTDFFGVYEMPLVVFLNTRRTGNILKGVASGAGSKFVDAPVLKDIIGSSEAIKEMATSKDDIISAIGENVANASISRLTPNLMNTIAKLIDGKERKADSVIEKIMSRVPFVREQLEEKISVSTGKSQEIQRLNTLLLGSRGKFEDKSPLAVEIGRLSDVGEPVNISDPSKSGDLAKLSESEKRKIQDEFAREYAKKAKKVISSNSYRKKTDEEKRNSLDDVRKEVVDGIKRKYRKQLGAIKKDKRKRKGVVR